MVGEQSPLLQGLLSSSILVYLATISCRSESSNYKFGRCLDVSEGQVRAGQVRAGQVRTGQDRKKFSRTHNFFGPKIF